MNKIKIIILITLGILVACFLYYIATINPSLNRARDIKRLREAAKITYNSKEIDRNYKEELIDIIERSEKAGMRNLPIASNNHKIEFYNKSNKIIYTLIFYPDEYDIGFSKRENTILEKDRERFLEIINYE